ncbi:hypothetical protein [Porphyromonas macacae]|uniref:hypothetical protein n=1 Tax=Porphyromonas macacae TaxID=28115 RepID=UPI00046AA84F|nr:hypothetical protein [Porphyromonas macacae]
MGIDVWEEAEKLQKGVEQLGLTWSQIVSNEEAAILYAIEDIPYIILFAPDGALSWREVCMVKKCIRYLRK